jgi:hypothetical protein
MMFTNEVVQFLGHHVVVMTPKKLLTIFKIVELIRYMYAY